MGRMIQPNPDHFATGSFVETRPVRRPSRTPAPRVPSRIVSPDSAAKAELRSLVERANAGEPVAQTELVQLYSRRVAGFVRSIVRQPDAIDDITQMVFIKMFRRLNRLRDPSVFESWLFTLARNTSLDFLRRCRCRPATVGLDEQVNEIADPSNSDASAEILAALDRALTRLSPLDRTLVSQFVAGDTYGEIAARAGLSLATVKVRLHRVRPFLRAWVGEMTDTRQPGAKGWRAAA